MTRVEIYQEGKLVANSLRDSGMPAEPLTDDLKQKLADFVNTERAAGRLPTVEETNRLNGMVAADEDSPAPLPKRPICEPLEINGTMWFPVRMDFASQLRVGMLMRDDDGGFSPENIGAWRALVAAVLHCGLWTGEKDDNPRFATFDDAMSFATEPDNAETILSLWNTLLFLNPKLLPQGKKK